MYHHFYDLIYIQILHTNITHILYGAGSVVSYTRGANDGFFTERPLAADQQARDEPLTAPDCAASESDHGESTALSPLPLIFSYKSEKSLRGAGGWRADRRDQRRAGELS